MKVKLISYSQPSKDILDAGLKDAQELIAFCARVSNPSNQYNTETSEKLIKYLIKHQHWSPLEMVSACLEIETTRDIARQFLRHRSFSFQEFCITGESKITTGWYNKNNKFVSNYISIETLYKRQNWKNYKDILVRVFDEEQNKFVTSKIKEVFKTGVKPVYKLTLKDGKQIECTKEHKFFSSDGWDTLENISGMMTTKTGKVILQNPKKIAVNGDICYQNKEWLAEKKQESIINKQGLVYIADSAGVKISTIRKWLKKHDLQFSKKEVASYSSVWNKGKSGYEIQKRTPEQKQHMRDITPKGAEHPAYKGGSRAWRASICNFFNTHRKDIFAKFNYTCQLCNKSFNSLSDKIELHHVKEVSKYPNLAFDLNNIVPAHRICHQQHHGKSVSFAKENKIKSKGNTLVPRFVEIKSIEFVGNKETYDLEVDHVSHNYVANKICVHNSQRYADPTKELSFVLRDARLQDSKNRQNSIVTNDVSLQARWEIEQQRVIDAALEAYKWATDHGIAKEQARAVLPEGNTVSRLYANGTIRSWVHYIQLRRENGTQLEHQEIALKCAEVISHVFPIMATL